MKLSAVANLLLVLALAGCYETPKPACAFGCGQDGACPSGYSCRADGWCKLTDVSDDFVCAPPVPDSAPPSPDGSVDASLADAGDAGDLDAAAFDAAPFDAPPPDASAADAMLLSPLTGSGSGS